MRKTWIAVATIALGVAFAVGYRLGRQDPSPSGPVEGARASEPAPSAIPPETASRAPGPSAEPSAPRQRVWGYDISSHRSSEREPARVESAPAQAATVPSNAISPPIASRVSPPVAPPVPIPAGSTVVAEAQRTAPARTSETAAAAAAPAPADDPESDRRAPALQFLRFDPPEIQDGATAVLTVGVTDDLSGVKSVSGTVRSPSDVAVIPFVGLGTAGGSAFTTNIAIPRQAETGDWYVSTLQIVDRANNPLNAAFGETAVPGGGTLRVASADSDSTPPTVHRVSIEKGSVGAGEKNQLFVDVDDDRSGVATITGVFQSPSKSAFIAFRCLPRGDTSWIGEVSIPASADCGAWSLQQLRVVDKANNTAFLTGESPEVGRVSFVVAGGSCDSEPPVIDAMYVAPSIVSNASASEVAVTVNVHDDGSGVGFLTGRIDGPVSANGQVPRIFFVCQPDPKNPEAPLTAKVAVPQFAASGNWRVTSVEVTDKAHNRRIYNRTDPVLAEVGFTVE